MVATVGFDIERLRAVAGDDFKVWGQQKKGSGAKFARGGINGINHDSKSSVSILELPSGNLSEFCLPFKLLHPVKQKIKIKTRSPAGTKIGMLVLCLVILIISFVV